MATNSTNRTVLFIVLGVLILLFLCCACGGAMMFLRSGDETPMPSSSSSRQQPTTESMSPSDDADDSDGADLGGPIPDELVMWVYVDGSYSAGDTTFTVSLHNTSKRTVRVSVLVLKGNLIDYNPTLYPSPSKTVLREDNQGNPYLLFRYDCPGSHCITLHPDEQVTIKVNTHLPPGTWRGEAFICWEDEHHCMQAPYGFTTK